MSSNIQDWGFYYDFCKFYQSVHQRGHQGDNKIKGLTGLSHFDKNKDYDNYDNVLCLIFSPYLQMEITNESGRKNDTFAWNLAKKQQLFLNRGENPPFFMLISSRKQHLICPVRLRVMSKQFLDQLSGSDDLN